VLLALVGGLGLVMNLIFQPDLGHLNVTITNATSQPVTDFGFQDSSNARWERLGPVAAGQTKIISKDYYINDCLEDLSFDQAGQTFYTRLNGAFSGGRDSITLNLRINPNQTVTGSFRTESATTQISQPASTQPLVYLDQNGKPLPVMR